MDSWLTNSSEKGALKKVNLEVRTRIEDWINIESDVTLLLDNEAIELEFISVLVYYTYMRNLEREESMMCRNDKSRVGP